MSRLLGTPTGSANAFVALLAGDTTGLDAQWLRRHGLAGYAAAAGMRHSLLRQEIATQLKGDQNQALDEALSALRGLKVIGFKGVDYARRLYPDPLMRPMGDHDLLVEDFPAALSRLRALGYRDALTQTGVAAHPEHYAAQLVRGAHHLDLHRSIRQQSRARVPYVEMFARAERDGDLWWLEPVDRLLVHCMHLAGHECLSPLIHYLDLELLLRETPIDQGVLDRAQRWRVSHALLGVLFVRARLHGWVASAFAGAELLPTAEEVSAQERPPRALQLVRKALLMDGLRDRVRFSAYALSALLRV